LVTWQNFVIAPTQGSAVQSASLDLSQLDTELNYSMTCTVSSGNDESFPAHSTPANAMMKIKYTPGSGVSSPIYSPFSLKVDGQSFNVGYNINSTSFQTPLHFLTVTINASTSIKQYGSLVFYNLDNTASLYFTNCVAAPLNTVKGH
jgi:hypothetical protein